MYKLASLGQVFPHLLSEVHFCFPTAVFLFGAQNRPWMKTQDAWPGQRVGKAQTGAGGLLLYAGVIWLCGALVFRLSILVSTMRSRSLYHKLLGKIYCHWMH